MNKKFLFLKIFGAITLFSALAFIFSFIVMWLWNTIIPGITGWKMISFWEAAGLLLLSKILFGMRGGRWHSGYWGHGYFWRKKWDNKIRTLSPEERERLKADWKKYCCNWEDNSSNAPTAS